MLGDFPLMGETVNPVSFTSGSTQTVVRPLTYCLQQCHPVLVTRSSRRGSTEALAHPGPLQLLWPEMVSVASVLLRWEEREQESLLKTATTAHKRTEPCKEWGETPAFPLTPTVTHPSWSPRGGGPVCTTLDTGFS